MLKIKRKLKNFLSQKNMTMPILLKEINDMKNKKNEINTDLTISTATDKRNAQNKLEGFILIGEDILKDMENRNFQIEQIFNKISYKSYKNYYNNVLKYYNLINNDCSQTQLSDNFVSRINPQNSIDNN